MFVGLFFISVFGSHFLSLSLTHILLLVRNVVLSLSLSLTLRQRRAQNFCMFFDDACGVTFPKQTQTFWERERERKSERVRKEIMQIIIIIGSHLVSAGRESSVFSFL